MFAPLALLRSSLGSSAICYATLFSLVGIPAQALAAGPEIAFDLVPIVECHDVTPADFAETHPDQMVVEAVLKISMRLKQGSARDVREITLEISSPDQSLLVREYAPDLVLESDVAGEIQVTDSHETGSTIGAGLSGGASLPYNGLKLNVSPNASIGTSKREQHTEVAKRIPDKDVVLVGGTMDSGYGTYFKFRPSGQTPVEGRKEFTCRYIVPRTWRGDWLDVSIHATGQHKEYFIKSIKPSGHARWQLGLYLAGDGEARRAAWRLAAAQGLVSQPSTSPAHATFKTDAAHQQVNMSSKRALVTGGSTAQRVTAHKPQTSWSAMFTDLITLGEASSRQTAKQPSQKTSAATRELSTRQQQYLAREALRKLAQTR